jgi:hypothetical protein
MVSRATTSAIIVDSLMGASPSVGVTVAEPVNGTAVAEWLWSSIPTSVVREF